jgi:hypothetical protein
VAPILLKEKLTKNDIISTVIIIVGAGLCVAFNSHKDENYTLSELIELFQSWIFIGYFIFLLSTGIIIRARISYVFFYKVQVSTQYIPMLYASLSSICGATSFTLCKAAVQLVKTSFQGDNQMVYGITYVILFIFITAAVLQVRLLNLAMVNGDNLLVVPLYFVLNTVLCISSGLIYFQEVKSICIPPDITSASHFKLCTFVKV